MWKSNYSSSSNIALIFFDFKHSKYEFKAMVEIELEVLNVKIFDA